MAWSVRGAWGVGMTCAKDRMRAGRARSRRRGVFTDAHRACPHTRLVCILAAQGSREHVACMSAASTRPQHRPRRRTTRRGCGCAAAGRWNTPARIGEAPARRARAGHARSTPPRSTGSIRSACCSCCAIARRNDLDFDAFDFRERPPRAGRGDRGRRRRPPEEEARIRRRRRARRAWASRCRTTGRKSSRWSASSARTWSSCCACSRSRAASA